MKRALFAAILLSGCATTYGPPMHPASLEQGMLIARVETHGPLFRRSFDTADWASLVQLDELGAQVPGKRAATGLETNGYVIFFDLPPGRYVLRTATFPKRGARYRVVAPPDKEFARSVELKAGSAAFLGDFSFDSRMPEFGTMLLRAGRIVGHWLTPFLTRPVIERETDLHGFEAGKEREVKALLAVRDGVGTGAWRKLVEKRLRELSAAEPAKTEGLRSKEIPLKEEPILSWRDTLKWGEPIRAPEGLAWVKPGTQTRVVIFYTTASAKGFAGWEAAVAELRRSGAASVEDEGQVFEVRVATRTGLASRSTKYSYAQGTLVGSDTKVQVTETVLIPDGWGMFTARLRATKEEFDAAVPAFHEFLTQVRLGPPPPKPPPKQEAVLPFSGVQ